MGFFNWRCKTNRCTKWLHLWKIHRKSIGGNHAALIEVRVRSSLLKREELCSVSEIKLFRLSGQTINEILGAAGGLEKSIQTLIEKNLDTMLGVRFLATEYPTGKAHGGRVDTLGIDENDCPVIVEYKKAISQSILTQGLFYLNWLLDHKAEFKLLVMEKLSREAADKIDWSDPRLICIAADFTRYDEHAVREMNQSIDLVRYRRFGGEFLALELVYVTSEEVKDNGYSKATPKQSLGGKDKPIHQAINDAEPQIRDLYELLRAFTVALGSDVQEKRLKLYVAFRRIKNFASVIVQKKSLCLYLKIDPATVVLEDGFSRDVRKIGHWGTGDLEIIIKNREGLKRAEPLILQSYEKS